ncbi:MAG: GIY-YIG nuclease family protein [Betaproteobacteria bacterium]|nr:GIY-YIG nuclease family protein [Betaproteobacteria bacterium]
MYFVYLITNKPYGTLYVGVTRDLVKRVFEHREGFVEGFSKQHDLGHLVWYEAHEGVVAAIEREKKIKKWRRDWKINLIQAENPQWKDLYETIV